MPTGVLDTILNLACHGTVFAVARITGIPMHSDTATPRGRPAASSMRGRVPPPTARRAKYAYLLGGLAAKVALSAPAPESQVHA
ncbi:hypothetical protein GCM10027168_21250 [Streptomyces capparidis]